MTTDEPTETETQIKSQHKRRSGNSVDLTYRYKEPSDDELSWTEDEYGMRRRRKRKSGGVDDFKTGILYVVIDILVTLDLLREKKGDDEVGGGEVMCILVMIPMVRVRQVRLRRSIFVTI